MQGLSFSILIMPVLAISLDVLLFVTLLRKVARKSIFKQYVLAVILFSFLLNAVWEILQIPLYKEGIYSFNHILFCLLASAADVIMVMLIYFGFAIICKNAMWVQNLKPINIIFLILVGGIGAILAETRHLSIGTWSYAAIMPVIPVVNVGLSPVLQFMILPLLIYTISLKIIKRYSDI